MIGCIDLDALRAYRQVGPLVDAYRKPHCYGSIAATSPPQPPFARPRARR